MSARFVRTCVGPAIFALGLLSGGCFTTTVRSGLPPAPPTVEYDAKWHSGLINGIVELSGPYDLHKVCPTGWAEIKTETSFVNGIVEIFTRGIYNPQSVTIRCSAATAATTPTAGTTPNAKAREETPAREEHADPL